MPKTGVRKNSFCLHCGNSNPYEFRCPIRGCPNGRYPEPPKEIHPVKQPKVSDGRPKDSS